MVYNLNQYAAITQHLMVSTLIIVFMYMLPFA